MIKIIFCLRRLPHLTREQFQRYWLEEHAPLVRACAAQTGLRRYVQSHTLDLPDMQPVVAARGIETPPFDGVAQLWFDSIDDLIAAGSTEEGQAAGRMLLADERKFIDLPNSPLFFSREEEIALDS